MGTAADTEGRGWWHNSYYREWCLVALLAVGILLPLQLSQPMCGYFDPHDPTINHPYAVHETFPSWTLPLVAGLAPFVVGLLVIWYLRFTGRGEGEPADTRRRSTWGHHVHTLLLCVVEAFVLAMLITNPIKNYAGRHRPDFVPRLMRFMQFDPTLYDIANPASMTAMLDVVCRSNNHKVWDGMRSFPSGHSSFAFAGWTVVAMLLVSGISWRQAGVSGFARLVLVGSAYVLPTIIAVSRTRDNRHNFGDVLTGSVIGLCAGVAVYLQHYSMATIEPLNRRTGLHAGTHDLDGVTVEEDAPLVADGKK